MATFEAPDSFRFREARRLADFVILFSPAAVDADTFVWLASVVARPPCCGAR